MNWRSAIPRSLALLLLAAGAWAQPSGTITGGVATNAHIAASCSSAHVQAKVDETSPGDTVLVPAGTCAWTSTVTLTRGIALVGSGTTITGTTNLVYLNANAAAIAAHDLFTVRGFTFDGTDPATDGTGSTGLLRLASAVTDYARVRITGNTFKNTGGRAIYVQGRFYGVVADNVFDATRIPISTYGDDSNSWLNETQAFGVEQNLYFEDNTIQFSQTVAGQRSIAGGQGGRIVVRYNTWNFDGLGYAPQLWEVHGLQLMQSDSGDYNCYLAGHDLCNAALTSCQQYSIMVSEFYGNNVFNLTSGNQWMQHRGGWMLFFGNAYAAASGANTGLHYQQYGCDSCQQYLAIRGPFTQHVSNTYVWNNFDKTTRTGMTKGADYCADRTASYPPYTNAIAENVDYWTDKGAAFDGSSGVGCGTFATIPPTCTTGVGYWATTQSCTALTGQIGKAPTTPLSGTLYKCTSPNTWTAYYTPYTYPHPLRAQ